MPDLGPSRDRVADPVGLVLPSRRRSVALLRRYAADACAALGWSDVADNVGLLVSEVATDLVVHSDSDQIRVRVLDKGLRLRVEVETSAALVDGSRQDDGHGQALLAVEALAVAWGKDVCAEGRTDWFELGV